MGDYEQRGCFFRLFVVIVLFFIYLNNFYMIKMVIERIFLIGVIGYVGGMFIDWFVKSEEFIFKVIIIDVFICIDDVEQKLKEIYGDCVNIICWFGLSDFEFIEQIVVNYDIVVNVGLGFFVDGVKVFVKGFVC